MENHSETPEYRTVSTWTELGKQLGVTRQTVYEWKKLPGAPTTPDVTQWKAFAAENQLGLVGNRVGKGRESLLEEKLVEEIKLLRIRNAKENRTVVDREAVDAMLLRVGSLMKPVLYHKLERELPPKAAGRAADEIAMLGREMADDICDIFRQGLEEWKAE